jgi:hypothetical protein
LFFLLDKKERKNQENPIRNLPSSHSLTPQDFHPTTLFYSIVRCTFYALSPFSIEKGFGDEVVFLWQDKKYIKHYLFKCRLSWWACRTVNSHSMVYPSINSGRQMTGTNLKNRLFLKSKDHCHSEQGRRMLNFWLNLLSPQDFHPTTLFYYYIIFYLLNDLIKIS